MKFRKLWPSMALAAAAIAALTFSHPVSAPAAPEMPFYLHPRDTVVFYGDSITDQRLYTMLTEVFTVTRYPKLDVRFIHSGWGGDRVTGGGGGPIDTRLERDVIAYHPNAMTIMLGMNDGKYAGHKPEDDEVYFAGYRHIIETVRHAIPGLRITAIEPSPFDDVTRPFTLQPGGYNAILVKYGEWLQQQAPAMNLDIANLNGGVVEMLRKANSEDSATAQKIIPDRVHPAFAGHLIMAQQLLKAWHARAIVSAVAVDASKGKAIECRYCSITDFNGATPLVWTQTDEALPLPFAIWLEADHDRTIGLAIRNSGITEALNEQPLRVTGLKSGRYKLTIDGETLATLTDAQLSEGVNLAILNTPMARQAAEVRDLVAKRIDVHQQRWRTFQLPMQDLNLDHLDAALKSLDALEADLLARERAAAQPHPHVFQLTSAP